MRLLLIGDGKMGHAIRDLAAAQGIEIAAMLAEGDNPNGAGIGAWAGRADVAVEFTVPAAAPSNVRACLEAGIPVVCGTTGWYGARADLEALAAARGIGLLIAPNFSLGVALFMALAEEAGRLFEGQAHFDGAIVETHHAAKLDAPSGTARALQDVVGETLRRELPVTSVRVGSVPGRHTLLFDGAFEQIVLTHEARDRRVFADGALRAASWLRGRRGVFTMRDVIGARHGS